MSEREKDQLGLKRRKRSCVSSMRSTVILKVCFGLFALCATQLLDGVADFIPALTFFCSARYCGDSAAITKQP